MISSVSFSILQPDYYEYRNEKYLLIWKDIPHWMIIDEEAFQFIRLADGSDTLEEILRQIYVDENIISLKKNEVKIFIENLIKNKILDFDNNKLPNSAIRSNPILENITLNITKKCNLRCKHCYIREYESNDTLNIDDFKNFVNRANEKHYLSKNLNFAILGGEPLLEKRKVIEIARFGQKLGFKVIISTNGLLLDSNFAEEAKETDLEVQISLDGASKRINDSIRGKGTFNKIEKALNLLVDYDVHSIISMVAHNKNYEEIEAFYHFGRKIGVNEIRYIPLKIMGQAKKNFIPIKRKQLLFAIHNLIEKYPSSKKYLGRDYYTIMKQTCANCSKTVYCGTGLKTILIDSDGEAYPCPNHNWPEFKCGNIHNNTFEEIWLESEVLQKLRKTYNINTLNDECFNCPVKYWCTGGCRGEAYENSNILTSKPLKCEEIRETIIETFWILSGEYYGKYPKQREYF